MSQTVILIVVISNMLITPIIQYLLSSRCSEVDCLCIKCKRDVVDINSNDIQNINKNKNNN
jgi:hypothetical protein